MEARLIRGLEYGPVAGVSYGEEDVSLMQGVTYDAFLEDNSIDTNMARDIVASSNVAGPIGMEGNPLQTKTQVIVKAEDDEFTSLNVKLSLVRREIWICDTESGEKATFKYVIDVAVFKLDGTVSIFRDSVESAKVKSFEWVTKATHALAMIPQDKHQKEAFQNMVQRCIEDETGPTEWIYPNAGWRRVDDKKWLFVHADGAIGAKDVLAHTLSRKYSLDINTAYLYSKDAFDMAMKMKEICKSGVASIELLLFTHASVLSTLFEEAGYPINFLFGIEGITNSRKTSMVLAVAKIFDRAHLVADAEFATATNCGIEKCLGTYHDGVVIIDDFKPGVNAAQQRMMDAKLDQLIRLCGNRVTKKRMTDFDVDGEKKYFPITGGCVITMELVSGVLSSITRMFLASITVDEVDNEKLGFYQSNRWVLPTHMCSFLSWVAANFEKVVQKIQVEYDGYRKSQSFVFGRYADMYATLMVTAQLLVIYATENNYWRVNQGHEFMMAVADVLSNELHKMGRNAQKKDKAQVVINAFGEMLFVSQLKRMELSAENCAQKYDCYEDGEKLYIRVSYARRIVNEYCKAHNELVEITTDDELIDILERLEVLEIKQSGSERERSRKLPIQRGNTLRYLYISKGKLASLFE